MSFSYKAVFPCFGEELKMLEKASEKKPRRWGLQPLNMITEHEHEHCA